MTKEKSINEALQNLDGISKRLSERGAEVGPLSNEIALLASELDALSHRPPGLKTKDFKYPIGEEVALKPVQENTSTVLERIIDESDLLPVWFLEQGSLIQQSVARVVLTKPHTSHGYTFPPGTGWATGFMVSPSLFLTNNHVIPEKAFANKIRIQFNFQLGPDGIEQPTESFFPDQNDVFQTSPELDYTLIRIRPNQEGIDGSQSILPGNRWGYIPLNGNPVYREKQHLNVIQHPSGRRKEVALQNNEIQTLYQDALRYKTDTEPGSSGSPVFDNLWNLVALHHAGGEKDAATGKWISNQGIRIDRIVEDLATHFGDDDKTTILQELGIL